jgi:hypothetical protein
MNAKLTPEGALACLANVPAEHRDDAWDLYTRAREEPELANVPDDVLLATICSVEAQLLLGFRALDPRETTIH